MTTIGAETDLSALGRRVRASQHARSFPLLAIGALLVNYGTGLFGPHPMSWRYGAPLAFVVVWALLKVNEARVGVGIGRADYLVAAGFVFAATNVTMLRPITNSIRDVTVVYGIWTAIVGVALLAVARAVRDGVLATAGLAVVAAGAFVAAFPRWQGGAVIGAAAFPLQPWVYVIIAAVGVALVLAGMWAYRAERASA